MCERKVIYFYYYYKMMSQKPVQFIYKTKRNANPLHNMTGGGDNHFPTQPILKTWLQEVKGE